MPALRITFIHCPNPYYTVLQNNGVHFMPVWAYTLAAHLPEDGRYQLTLHDDRVAKVDTVEEADIFLFSGINQDHPTLVDYHTALKARFPAARFVIGGPIGWSFEQAGDMERLAMFDHVVVGDGENVIAGLLDDLAADRPVERLIHAPSRFDLLKARPMHRGLLRQTVGCYYGAVLEVARGCPFLCEFCDIRVLPDNNRAHCKPAELIVAEMDELSRLGVKGFLFACDNFIGDPRWAEQVVDGLLEWQERTGYRPSIYTWLTINLYKFPVLMAKMRRAGFDMLFIGIESFNSNSLLETAKVQNTAASLAEAVKDIQSYGFFIVGGLIFGFDSDGEDCFDVTLDGLLEAGLLSGDPSLLTALPGTPLYRRMKLSGRLRDVRYGLGGHKYQTNIRYLMPKDRLVAGFRRFVTRLTAGEYQVARLRAYFDNLDRGNFIPVEGAYADLRTALKTILTSPAAVKLGLKRFGQFLASPSNLYWLAKGFWLVASRRHIKGRFSYFQFWFALWSTVILKYRHLSEDDFDIDSVGADFDAGAVLDGALTELGDEQIPETKKKNQARFTLQALTKVAESRRTGSA